MWADLIDGLEPEQVERIAAALDGTAEGASGSSPANRNVAALLASMTGG